MVEYFKGIFWDSGQFFGQFFEDANAILISDYDEILVKIMRLMRLFRQSPVALAYNFFRVSVSFLNDFVSGRTGISKLRNRE